MFRLLIVLSVFLAWLSAPAAQTPSRVRPALAADDPPVRDPAGRTLSPYFFVKSDDPSLDQFPLKATSAEADIVGVIARVTVTQVYANQGTRAIEAVYIFPGSMRAAVHGMKMTIGERTIVAQIEERQEARRQYEQARQAGQTASLLEQQRPNVFQMHVANILPGDEVKVELVYSELLVPEHGVYEFVYPTVVGPRYSRTPAEGAPDTAAWVQNPYLKQGTPAPATTFGFRARLATSIPLKDVTSPSHELKVDFASRDRASVTLASEGTRAGNRDLVLRYRLTENQIETGVLVAEGRDESFFLCTIEPPRRFPTTAIPPREYIFIVDVSGSMHGFPLDTSKQLLAALLGRLRPADSFNMLFFAGGSFLLSPTSLEATEANTRRALDALARQQGAGGTELLPALARAIALPRTGEGVARTIVIVTDGYVDVEREAFDLIRQGLGRANVFTFGIGSSVNRYLIEGMARIGEGLPFVVLEPAEAGPTAARFLEYIQSPLLTQVDVRFSGLGAYDVEPARVPDLFAERPIVLTGKFHGAATGTITISGFTGQGRFEKTLKVVKTQAAAEHEALKYLWARERLSVLSDYAVARGDGGEDRAEITELGLKYGLLTEYTSFVAIDRNIRRTDGTVETVKQPLPLPQGVSNRAVGDAAKAQMAGFAVAGGVVGGMPEAPPLAESAARGRSDEALPPAPRERQPSRVRVVIEDNRLVTRLTVSTAKVQAEIEQVVSALEPCFASAPRVAASVRLELHFDGRRQVARVVLLTTPRGSEAAAECLRAALRKVLALPAAARGTVVVSIGW